MLLVWSDNLDTIIPTCRDFEDKLIKLVWRARPPLSSSASALTAGSLGSMSTALQSSASASASAQNISSQEKLSPGQRAGDAPAEDADVLAKTDAPKKRSFLFGWRVTGSAAKTGAKKTGEKDVEAWKPEPRPLRLFAPIYGGLGAGLSVFFIGSGLNVLIQVRHGIDHESALDANGLQRRNGC